MLAVAMKTNTTKPEVEDDVSPTIQYHYASRMPRSLTHCILISALTGTTPGLLAAYASYSITQTTKVDQQNEKLEDRLKQQDKDHKEQLRRQQEAFDARFTAFEEKHNAKWAFPSFW